MRRPHSRLHNHNPAVCLHSVCSKLWLIANYLLAGFKIHLGEYISFISSVQSPQINEVAQPLTEWHYLLGWLVVVFGADSFKSISNFDPDHLIRSQALRLVPTGNQCCLS